MNILFEEIFVDQVYHFASVVKAIRSLKALLELLITLFEVTKDIFAKPGSPASVSAGEKIPMFFFLLIFGVAPGHQIFDLLISQFHLLYSPDM
ncbi:Uncharacterised protein [Enterobacter hormaechei]|nr:Uncharacterised protein [Enterobacter hormaechei]